MARAGTLRVVKRNWRRRAKASGRKKDLTDVDELTRVIRARKRRPKKGRR